MRTKTFYEYCRDHRQSEPDAHKREAMQDVYKFMFECGYGSNAIMTHFSYRIMDAKLQHNEDYANALVWLRDVFVGKVSVGPEQTGSLWSEA